MCSPFIKPSTTRLSSQWPPLINFESKPLPHPHTRPLAANSSEVSALSAQTRDAAQMDTLTHIPLYPQYPFELLLRMQLPSFSTRLDRSGVHPIHPSLQQTHTGVYEWEIQGKSYALASCHKMPNKI